MTQPKRPFNSHNLNKTPCPRCGFRRFIDVKERDNLCGSCKEVEPNWPDFIPVEFSDDLDPADDTAVCEDCGDTYDQAEGCQHDGHRFCPCCLMNCLECGDAIRQDAALEAVNEGRWS